MQMQGGCFRPPSRRLSRPSTAQRAAAQPTSGHAVHASGSTAAGSQDDTGSRGLVIKGGRKVQSARPSERVSMLLPVVHKQHQRFSFDLSVHSFSHMKPHKSTRSLESCLHLEHFLKVCMATQLESLLWPCRPLTKWSR